MNKLPFFYFKSLCKQGKKINALLFCLLLVCCCTFNAQASLSGPYTIDPNGTASSTNYLSFASAVSDMINGTRADGGTPNGSGISSSVVFTVAAGTYTGQLDITAITGVSATNTITFDGGAGNASTRIITFGGATSVATAYTVRINNSQYIRFYNLTIQASSASYGWPLHVMNNSSNTKVKNCIINFTSLPSTHTNTNNCAVVLNNSSTGPTGAGSAAINVEIDSNIITGGYGNYLYGTGSNTGIYFRNNEVTNSNFYGVYLQGLSQVKVNNNIFNLLASGNLASSGIYMNACNAGTGFFHELNGNKITNCGQNGIYMTGTAVQTTPRSQMFNNAIGGGFRNASPYGIYIQNNSSISSWDVFHNSVNIDNAATGGTSAALYISNCCNQGGTANYNLDVRNNILAVTGAGSTAIPLYYASTNSLQYAVVSASSLDYNIYYKQGMTSSTILVNLANLTNYTVANVIGNGGYNVNSKVGNPGFTSATNLLPYNACNNGTGITAITTDIAGNTRNSSTPDIGAYEVTPVPNDIGVESLTTPVLPFASGSQNITAVIKNYGSNTITSANISYSVNGSFPVMINYSGSLAPCATATVTFSGGNQYTFLPNTAYSIKVYSDNPNLSADANLVNDTFTVPLIFTGMTGNYTIDQGSPASSSNFVSFTDAVNALNYGGVSGPVNFDVIGSTPYNEQVSLENVPGTSAANTITFDGGAGNAANRILTFAATAVNPYTFRINNTPYVTLKNLTIRGSGSNNAWAVHILGNSASNIRVKNCMIDFVGGGGVTGLNTNFIGILINNSATNLSTNSLAINIEIDSNTITGGNAGIYAYTQNCNNYLFTNNKINNAYQYGIYAYYLTAFKCNFNTINMNPLGAAGSSGLYFNFCANSGTYAKEVINNVITNAGQYGMVIYYLQGSSAMRSKIINNVVGGNFRSTDPSGIYMYQNSNYADVWFNSINVDNVATSTTSAALRLATSCTNLDVRNNNLAVTNASSTAFALLSDATNSFLDLNYNNYYKVSPASLITLNGVMYSSGNYKGVGGYNINSVNINPAYTSSTNLKTNLLCNQGVAIASVPRDFEGDLRGTVPDIGADENTTAVANDLTVVELLSPSVPLSVGVQNLRVVIKNNGSNPITGAEIAYSMNGGAPVLQTWAGNLNPCDSTVVEFNATSGLGSTDQRFKVIPGFTYSFKVYSSMPNSTTDGNTLNDTILFGPLCPALAGQFFIDSSSTVAGIDTFTSFTSAALALNCGGISGPVVFNVLKGTYDEQITLNDVVGSSATNTITFDGGAGNDSTRIITFGGQANTTRHTVLINGAKNIFFRNLTIRGKGATYGWPFHILGAANNISVKNCVIDFEGLGVNAASTNFISVVVNNSTTAPTTTGTFNNIEFEKNKIAGGYSNIYFSGNGSNTGISFRNNRLYNADNYGAYISNVIAPKIVSNTVNMRLTSTTSTGIYLVSVITNATGNAEVLRNRVYDAGQYGIYINSNTATALRPNLLNNSIGGQFRNTSSYNGINITSSPNWNVIYNSVLIDTPSVAATGTTSGSIYITGSTLLDCRNNSFFVNHVTAGANVLAFRSTAGVTFVTSGLNYNNYYKEGNPTNLIQVNGTNYTPSNYNTATSGGLNSVNNNAGYVQLITNKDIIPVSATNNGINVPTITNRDINDSIRNNPPDIGAFEIPSGLTTDLGLVASISPDTALSSGSKQIKVVIKNYGVSTIFSFNLRHTVNGANMQDSAFSGLSIATNDQVEVTLNVSKNAVIPGAISTTYKVYLHNPNGFLDDNQVNDTITIGPRIPTLNGLYTIDPAGSGVTNYVSFATAVTALNVAGVSGPVTFQVAPGTYTEQVNLGAIVGASATNTITFDGLNAANAILTFAGTSTTNYWTVKLNNSPYVGFRNLTIRATGAANGVPVQISGTSHFTRIKKCTLEITGAGATATTNNYAGILISNTTTVTAPASGTLLNNIEIDSNTINGGYYGIYAYSNTSTPYAGLNKYRGNTIVNVYSHGGYFYYNEAVNFSGNTVTLRTSTANTYGVYLDNCQNSGTNIHTISGNNFTRVNTNGIYVNGGNSTGRNQINNNMVLGFGSASSYGMYIYNTSNYDIYHNTVFVDASTSSPQYAALYVAYGSNVDIKNNIFVAHQSGIGIPVYTPSAPGGYFTMNYNNLYKYNGTASTGLFYNGSLGATYTSANLAGGGGLNTNSVSTNPGFVSLTNLHLSNACSGRGVNMPSITRDIDGDLRNTIPNMGADEGSGLANDAGVEEIKPFVAGTQDVKVVIRNFGSNAITSVNVSYSVNGSIAKVTQWTGTLNPCDTVTVVFTGVNQYTFQPGVSYTIEASTSLPNFATDPKASNDVVVLGPTCIYLSGNYTINPAGSGVNNFTTLSDAVSALNCGGINGPVSFKLAPGTYNEQVSINSVLGASATNRITFEADSALRTIITYAASVNTQAHTFKLNNAPFVTLRNLTIETTGATYGVAVHVMGNSNSTRIKNCILKVGGSGAASTSNYFMPVLINNFDNITNPTSVGSSVSSVEIDSNILANGYYNIMIWGTSGSPYANGISIRNNRMDSAYYNGIYAYYLDGINFNYNTVNMRVSGSNNSAGVSIQNGYFATGSNVFTITNNRVINAGQYGFYIFQNYNGNSAYRSKFINNMSGGGFRNNQATAIYFRYLNYWDIWNNTANLDFPTTQSQYAAMYVSDGGSHDIKNNMLVNSATSGSGVPFYGASSGILTALNYNNYFNNAGTGLLTVGGPLFTAGDFINGGGFNQNSKNQNPGFPSATDLHLGSGCINGTPLAGITTDFEGHTRNTPPDMGADEFINSLSNDIGVAFINSPKSPFAPGIQDVVLRINNYGVNAITAVNVSYSINGGPLRTIAWTGNLAPCDTTSVVFTGANQFNFALGGSYTLKAYTSLPNGVADANPSNDTLTSTACPALNGAYTINPAGSGSTNFTTFAAAANALSCGGVSGPVTFTVSTGTYNEQFTIGSIVGASATNRVEFRPASNNANDVILTFNTTNPANNYIANLTGADYVRFVKFTFAPTNVNYGVAVALSASSDYNTFDSCTYNGLATTSATSNLAFVFVNGSKDNYNVFSNSTFNNGAYGVYWFATSTQYAVGNQFVNNTFNNQYAFGIYTYYMDYLRIRKNIIKVNTGYTSYSGINTWFTYNTTGASDISKNEITGSVAGGYGMYLYYSNYGGNSTYRFLISNNTVSLTNTTTNALYGIATYYSYYIDILHNTINVVNVPTGTSYAFRNQNFFSTGCLVQNNVFVNSTAGGASNFAVGEQVSSAGTWNNNNYFSSGTNMAQWGGTGYTDLPGWRTASSNQDLNSYNLRPQFASATNLSFNNLPCLNNGGANVLTKVPDDLRGVARTTTPDIGALEFTPDSLDASAEVIHSPSGAVTIGNSYAVAVRVRNAGANVITSLNVSYRVNGGTPVTQSFTGLSLNPCDTMKVVFDATSGPGNSDQRYVAAGGLNDIKAFTSAPNTRADLNNTNDTTSVILCTPFAGTFSINASQPLSATNFPSFTAALNALNGCGGITGPVTFNVAAGTYNEQLDITPITGISATNTLTFNGGAGNAATRVLTFGGATNTARHTLRLNNAQYITFKNITIQTTGGSYGWGVHLMGTAYNNTISNCIIDIAGAGASSTSTNFSGIVASGSTTSSTTGLRIDSLTLDSNTVNGGYYGIILYGVNGNTSVGTLVRGNKINNSYYYGTYLYFQNAFKLNNNKVSMRTGVNASQNSTGMYVSDCNATGTGFHEFSGNMVVDATNVGIQLQNTGTASSAIRSRFWNNMINGGFTYQYGFGVNMSSSSNWDVFHNSINHDAVTTNALYSAFYLTGGSSNAIKNNIFVSSGNGSTGLAFYANSAASLINTAAFNYNMFYKVGNTATSPLIYFQGTYSNTTTIGAFGSNTNSFVQNPNFLGTKNLHVKDGCFNGDSLGVTIDIDGNTRASFADIGADEVPSDSNDIGVQFMLKPGVPIASGLQDVQVIIKNFGSKEVIGGTVSYSVNNGAPVSINFTDTIAPCDTALVTFTGAQQYNFVLGSSYELKIFTSQPNGQQDLYTANDTFSTGNICLGMAGNYTINPSGTGPNNYTSFAAAITALQCGGVAGTVNFDVAAGTYNEQVSIPYIPGVSVANRIIFNGGVGNKASRILTFAASTQNDAHTLRFNNTSFVEFHNMTIRGTGVNYAWPVHVLGTTNSVKVRNSTIEVTAAPVSNTSLIAVVMNGAVNTPYAQAKQDSVEIDSNTIINGYASIWAYNSSGVAIKVRNNVLNNPYYYGMYFQSSPALIVQNNTINMFVGGDVASQGIYMANSSSTATLYNELSGNKIYDMGQYGIYAASSGGSFASRALMFNNVITGFRNNSSHAGIVIDNSSYWGIYFNTVNSDVATSGVSGALSFINGNQNDIRNNIFAVTAANSSMLAVSSPSAVSASIMDYNNYYKVGNANSLITIGTNTYGSSNFIGAAFFNGNSFSRDPLFTSARNLHVGNGCNNGVVIAGITTDMDGDTRVSPPDVGADEVTTGVNDNIGVVNIISPVSPLTAGPQDIRMIIANLGNNEVTSATISYSVNGGAPVTVVYTDSIHPCDTALVEFTGLNQYNFAVGGSYTIKAYTSFPNSTNDNNHIDDTITVGPVCTGLRGAYTINPTGSGTTNYTTFNSAVNALMCGGVSGHVTFTVSDATYNEQVSIGNIPGIHDTARVTFIGTTQAGTILSYMAGNANASHTLRINNSPYINIYNMTIQTAGASIGSAVHILGSSNYVKVKRCLIRASGAGASSTSQYLIPVLINSTTDITNPALGGTGVTNVEIDSNRIVAGYYSIYATGKSSTPMASTLLFRKNIIDSSYAYGANIQNYIDAVTFSNNEVNMRITGSANSYGFAIQNCYPLGTNTAGHTITNNKVINAGQYGMYIYQSYASAAFRSKFVNNMVGGGFRSNNSYGVQYSYLNYWDIFNNTVNLDFATTGNQYAAMSFQSGSQQDVRNNLVVYSATSGSGVPFYYSGSGFTALNYNNLYNYASANVLSIGGTAYDSVAFVGQGGFNANSRALLTPFANSRNLHLTASPANKGVTIASVLTDIDNETRLSPPDVGADEYFSSMDIGVFTIDSPSAAAFCGANKNLVVKLKNYGNQTVVNANIDIVVNGILYNSIPWTGNLAGGATSAQINLGAYSFSSGSYSVSVSTSSPNGGTDVNANNDSAFKNVTITPSVTPAISLSASQTTLCSGVEVTFIAQYSGGGTSPILQWRKNGLTMGFTGDTLKTTALNDKDSFVVILTSSAACATPQSVVSNHVKMNVGLTVAPDVSLASTATTICDGTSVTFTATPLNGGPTPTYTWYKNGVVTGGSTSQYTSSTLQNGDSITVVLNSSLGCANPPKDTSAAIKMIVNPLLLPSATITASNTSFCAGTSVTFAATTVNQGTAPFYQWKRNGITVGINNDTLIINNLNNNDSISLVLTSNATCATPAIVESNKIPVNVIALVVPTVSITNTTGTICTGSNASFTANPVNAGVNATYNWTVNSVSAGTGKTFSSTTFNHRDTVRLIITADTLCASPQQVTSSYVLMDVKQYVTPDVTITPLNPAMCAGGSTTFTATPVNGGTAPSYQWIRNGVPVGTDSIRYFGTFNTADSVAVIITSNEMCLTRTKDTSAHANVTITAPVTPLVTIAATADSVCANGSLTFTATPTNGGTAPGYQWKKNGVNIGTNSAVQTFSSIANNDSFTVVLTSNAGCAVPTTATSNKLGIVVIPNVTPSVTIAASASSICAGGSVTFTATPVNGGAAPAYQWKKNGTNIGISDAVQTFSSINNNDNFTVVLTSNARCASPATATSAGRQITVTPNVTPSVSINASKTSICLGESVTYTATPTNGGTTPAYQWKVNGVNAGTNSNVFTSTSISGTDTVTVELTSSITCVTAATVTSNKVKLTANAPVVPAVTVAASKTVACNGTSIMFVATPANGGTNPTFQWKINGSNVSGQTNDTFTTSTLGNNDSVWVTMTSNALCAAPASVASVKTPITITMPVAPALSIVASVNTICRGEGVTYTATPTNGGTAPVYKWMQNGVEVGTNSPTFTTTTLQPEEDVTCMMTTDLTCVTSATVLEFAPSVLVKIPPVKPVVTRASNTLSTATPSQSYQWYRNDTSISGATARNFALAVNGQYSVKVDSNGCNATSDKFSVTDLGVGLNEISTIGNIELYPNPATSAAYLSVKFTTTDQTEISIVDMYGKLVKTIPVGDVSSYNDMINMSEYADGVYFILIKHGENMSQKRLVKAN